MRNNRDQQILQVKTGNSQQSNIDLFSKYEACYLQKFFKMNLIDYFPQSFTNVYEDILEKKVNIKNEQALSNSLFLANENFLISQFEENINHFYSKKAKSISQKHLPFSFVKVYSNSKQVQQSISKGEFILVDVKIKLQVQKIEEVPYKILKALQQYTDYKAGSRTQMENILEKYGKENFNLFFIYFGDVNFNLFNKKNYEIQQIKILGKVYKLKINVFCVSKQALLETFRSICKIENNDYVTDIQFQFYKLKREKMRRKKNKIIQQNKSKMFLKDNNIKSIAFGAIGIIGLLTFGIAIKKIFI